LAGLQRALPASYYLDEAAFRRERERLLYREWCCAGRADQVERPGSLQVVEVAGESVLLVRTRAGELRAHYNVCRHRGSQVVPCPPVEPGGPQAGPARKAGSLRYPYHSWTDVHGLWQADGGIVPAARGTRIMQRLAAGHGATLVERTPVTAVRDLGGSVEVATAGGAVRAGRLLLCADAWTAGLVAQLGVDLPLVVTQEQFSYFRPADPAAFAVGRFPVWIWMDDPSFYGFPVWPDAALKAAQDVGGHQVTASSRGFDPDPAAAERLAGFLGARLPTAAAAHDHSATCLYTLTPDRDLVLGPLPGHHRVLVALGAAHGFKFAPLVGRALADLALHDGTDVDLTPFALDRPALPHQPHGRGQVPGLSGARRPARL
jgi:glycine/D-amino acid oxidase-like deaminating enzyme